MQRHHFPWSGKPALKANCDEGSSSPDRSEDTDSEDDSSLVALLSDDAIEEEQK
jgi:hypothetical protein